MPTAADNPIMKPLFDPLYEAYDRTRKFFSKVPEPKKGPNPTVKRLDEKADQEWRKEVADSFKPRAWKSSVRKTSAQSRAVASRRVSRKKGDTKRASLKSVDKSMGY